MIFRDLEITNDQDEKELPSVAVEIKGEYLENLIEGYTTLNVKGRETIEYETQSIRRPFADGEIYYKKTIPPRIITVYYRLESSSPSEQQAKFNKLRKLLYLTNLAEVKFRDEIDFTYYATVETIEEVDETSISVNGAFTLRCSDPYKYGPEKRTNGEIVINTVYETYPEKIIVDLDETVDELIISSAQKRIILKGNINLGSQVEIDVKNQNVKVNGIEQNYLIALNSDFENFNIYLGQTISSSSGQITVVQREKA